VSILSARAPVWLWLLLGACLAACGSGGSAARPPAPTWLSEDRDERLLQLERQLRGFDVAMMEVGHRYIDLYWAGRDANWEAAAYSLQKIRIAIENGLERRPKRADSARPFLAGPLRAMDDAVSAQDPELFAARFQGLTAGCNTCHATEQVSFFEIRAPTTRVSPVHGGAGEPPPG
jgi:hypothetical protein